MARLTAKARKATPKAKFGLPGKKTAKNPTGKGGYPMPDKKHAELAEGFAKRFASPAQRAQIDAKAQKVIGKKHMPANSAVSSRQPKVKPPTKSGPPMKA